MKCCDRHVDRSAAKPELRWNSIPKPGRMFSQHAFPLQQFSCLYLYNPLSLYHSWILFISFPLPAFSALSGCLFPLSWRRRKSHTLRQWWGSNWPKTLVEWINDASAECTFTFSLRHLHFRHAAATFIQSGLHWLRFKDTWAGSGWGSS